MVKLSKNEKHMLIFCILYFSFECFLFYECLQVQFAKLFIFFLKPFQNFLQGVNHEESITYRDYTKLLIL